MASIVKKRIIAIMVYIIGFEIFILKFSFSPRSYISVREYKKIGIIGFVKSGLFYLI